MSDQPDAPTEEPVPELELEAEQPSASAPRPPEPPPETDRPFLWEPLEDAPGCTASVLGLPLKAWDTAAIILITLVADICLYAYPGGLGAAVLLTVATIGLFSLAPKPWRIPDPFLLLAVALIVAASVWNIGPLLAVVAVLAVAGLAVKLHQPAWSITEVGWTVPWTAVLAPARFLGHLLRAIGCTGEVEPEPEEEEQARGPRLPLRVVLVPLLVVVVFILIFRAASPVIERLTRVVFDWLIEWIEELWRMLSVARIFSWLFWLMVFAALIRPIAGSFVAEALAKRREGLEEPPPARDNSNYATAAATLIAVNLLFIAFHAFDWPTLYFGADLPKGASFSDFARGGCKWLTVGLLLSTAIIGIIFRKRMNFHPGSQLLRGLAYVWAGLNGVLAVGALRRLQIYVDYNGMTRMRILGLYGILLVAAGLILMVVKVKRKKNVTWLVRRDLAALWIAIVLFALTPLDYLSWSYNAQQALNGNHRPLANVLVQKMSPESFPPLIPLLDVKDEKVREGVRSRLSTELLGLRKTRPENWTQWQGSHAWALEQLEAVSEKLLLDPASEEKRKSAWERFDSYVKPWIHTIRRGSYD